jgi:hypothetical protein
VRFQPGQSGNPGGRPSLARDFRERCQNFMEADGWKRLNRMARGRGPFAYQALQLIAAYAYGKPSQPITGPDDGPIQFAYAKLESDIQREAEKVITERARLLALAGGDDGQTQPENARGDMVHVADSGGPGLGQDANGR